MKKFYMAVALAGVLASYQCSALTLNVNVGRLDGYYTYSGGEFDITSVNSDPTFNQIVQHNYVPGLTSINGGFETFCLDPVTELQGNPQIGTVVMSGVSAGTGWLYRQFASGTLAGYDYADTTPGGSGNSGRAQSAMALQIAIWELQGYSQAVILSESSLATPTVLADAANFVSMASGASGDSGVGMLQLSYAGVDGQPITSQPMLIAVPDGGMTAMLLGMALAGFGLISRKLRRA